MSSISPAKSIVPKTPTNISITPISGKNAPETNEKIKGKGTGKGKGKGKGQVKGKVDKPKTIGQGINIMKESPPQSSAPSSLSKVRVEISKSALLLDRNKLSPGKDSLCIWLKLKQSWLMSDLCLHLYERGFIPRGIPVKIWVAGFELQAYQSVNEMLSASDVVLVTAENEPCPSPAQTQTHPTITTTSLGDLSALFAFLGSQNWEGAHRAIHNLESLFKGEKTSAAVPDVSSSSTVKEPISIKDVKEGKEVRKSSAQLQRYNSTDSVSTVEEQDHHTAAPSSSSSSSSSSDDSSDEEEEENRPTDKQASSSSSSSSSSSDDSSDEEEEESRPIDKQAPSSSSSSSSSSDDSSDEEEEKPPTDKQASSSSSSSSDDSSDEEEEESRPIDKQAPSSSSSSSSSLNSSTTANLKSNQKKLSSKERAKARKIEFQNMHNYYFEFSNETAASEGGSNHISNKWGAAVEESGGHWKRPYEVIAHHENKSTSMTASANSSEEDAHFYEQFPLFSSFKDVIMKGNKDYEEYNPLKRDVIAFQQAQFNEETFQLDLDDYMYGLVVQVSGTDSVESSNTSSSQVVMKVASSPSLLLGSDDVSSGKSLGSKGNKGFSKNKKLFCEEETFEVAGLVNVRLVSGPTKDLCMKLKANKVANKPLPVSHNNQAKARVDSPLKKSNNGEAAHNKTSGDKVVPSTAAAACDETCQKSDGDHDEVSTIASSKVPISHKKQKRHQLKDILALVEVQNTSENNTQTNNSSTPLVEKEMTNTAKSTADKDSTLPQNKRQSTRNKSLVSNSDKSLTSNPKKVNDGAAIARKEGEEEEENDLLEKYQLEVGPDYTPMINDVIAYQTLYFCEETFTPKLGDYQYGKILSITLSKANLKRKDKDKKHGGVDSIDVSSSNDKEMLMLVSNSYFELNKQLLKRPTRRQTGKSGTGSESTPLKNTTGGGGGGGGGGDQANSCEKITVTMSSLANIRIISGPTKNYLEKERREKEKEAMEMKKRMEEEAEKQLQPSPAPWNAIAHLLDIKRKELSQPAP